MRGTKPYSSVSQMKFLRNALQQRLSVEIAMRKRTQYTEIMEWVVILWIGLAIVVGVAANTRGRIGLGWFGLAILLSPLLAGLLMLALPPLRRPVNITVPPDPPDERKPCPFCAERI